MSSKMSKIKRVRLQAVVSEDMASRVSVYADKLGVSVSSLCAMLIGQGIMNFDKAYELLETTALKTIINGKDIESPENE